jgi:hypothetical protein
MPAFLSISFLDYHTPLDSRHTAPRVLLGPDDNPQLLDGVLTAILILFLPWAFKGTA